MPTKSVSRKPDYRKKTYLREHYIRQGLTCAEIGDMNGVSAVTIHNWLVKLDIPVRSRGARHPLNPKWNDGTADASVRRCTNCGKSGHNARTCGIEQDSPSKTGVRRCGNCGEVGHNVRTCNPESEDAVVKTISIDVDTDPAIQHLIDVRDKLRADLANVEQALSLVRKV